MSNKSNQSVAYCGVEFTEEIYGHQIPEDRYGYRLIGGKFVPISFLERIEDHLGCTTFNACCVFSPRKMVRKKFWNSLFPDEQEILPACLFQLIGEGRITFTFPE